uniref:Uncharacterized protein n=1 Tax=Globodera rostochiensis TaxID=31243 RepID=A0A914HZN7_GLORO
MVYVDAKEKTSQKIGRSLQNATESVMHEYFAKLVKANRKKKTFHIDEQHKKEEVESPKFKLESTHDLMAKLSMLTAFINSNGSMVTNVAPSAAVSRRANAILLTTKGQMASALRQPSRSFLFIAALLLICRCCPRADTDIWTFIVLFLGGAGLFSGVAFVCMKIKNLIEYLALRAIIGTITPPAQPPPPGAPRPPLPRPAFHPLPIERSPAIDAMQAARHRRSHNLVNQ